MTELTPYRAGHGPVSGMQDGPAWARPAQGGLGAAIGRRKGLLIGVSLVVFAVGAGLILAQPPRYRAEAVLVLEPREGNQFAAGTVDRTALLTEAGLLRSRDLASQAVQELGLAGNPDTLAADGNPLLYWTGLTMDAARRALADLMSEPMLASPTADPLERAIDAYLDRLSVTPADGARLLTVGFTAADPALAARAANLTAQLYLEGRTTRRDSAAERAGRWLSQKLDSLRADVLESARRLEEYRRRSGVVEVGGNSLQRDQLSQVSTQLVAAVAQRTEAEARAQQVRRLLDRPGAIDSASIVLNTELVRELRLQEAAIQRRMAELRTQYREEHPRLIEAQAELEELRGTIAQEVRKLVASLENEAEVARVRERALQLEVERLTALVEGQNEAEAAIRALEEELRTRTQLYEAVLTRANESELAQRAQQGFDARLVSAAAVPRQAAQTAGWGSWLLAAAVALLSGLLAAGLAGRRRTRFADAADLEAETGLPVLAALPALRKGQMSGRAPHELALEQADSPYAESLRRLRTTLALAGEARNITTGRSVLVTSSLPGEGRSTIALGLAVLAAKGGARVLLIDADLRAPGLHEVLGVPNERGLSDYLAGAAELGKVTEFHLAHGLYVIPAGTRLEDPSALLARPVARDLMAAAASGFDLVVIDSSAVLPAPDALLLARHADQIVHVVASGQKRGPVLAALASLNGAGAVLSGMVLNRADPKRIGEAGSVPFASGHVRLDRAEPPRRLPAGAG
ncbi:GumC family protein [Oceanibaculum indicum]|uniref:Capsular exopolysaccharide synthesis family protein n=1 Tax=Oceanibaculum indicum TaxID=526216 RepID=A0A420WCP5_9PROT|nr:Wzz/FepE/Etk N-terminal domain-containing protein [Oceanibaculum indicum]RKQ68799.1 capsular exopolysaccharide synthesis family protein [Oceanibaculum indicum]